MTSSLLKVSSILFLVCTLFVLLTSAQELDVTGRYRLYSSQNFDEFLKALGIGYFNRLAATKAIPDYVITKNGDAYTLRTVTSLTDSAITFKNGVEFKESRLDGLNVRSVINIDGNTWTQIQYGNPEVKIVRVFENKEVKVTSICKAVSSLRKYKKM